MSQPVEISAEVDGRWETLRSSARHQPGGAETSGNRCRVAVSVVPPQVRRPPGQPSGGTRPSSPGARRAAATTYVDTDEGWRATRTGARAEIGTWISGFYNPRRRHSACGRLSPDHLRTSIIAATTPGPEVTMQPSTGARLALGIVVVAAQTSAGCSSSHQNDACRTSSATITVVMQPKQGTTAQVVRAGGSVNVRRWSSRDTILFHPANGLSPFTVSRGVDLSFTAEKTGSYTVNEVDVAGRSVATAQLTVRSC